MLSRSDIETIFQSEIASRLDSIYTNSAMREYDIAAEASTIIFDKLVCDTRFVNCSFQYYPAHTTVGDDEFAYVVNITCPSGMLTSIPCVKKNC